MEQKKLKKEYTNFSPYLWGEFVYFHEQKYKGEAAFL